MSQWQWHSLKGQSTIRPNEKHKIHQFIAGDGQTAQQIQSCHNTHTQRITHSAAGRTRCDVMCCAVHHQWQQSIIIMNRYRFIIRYSIWYFPFGRSSILWVRYRLLASTKYPNINLLWLVGVLFVEKEIRSESYCKSDEKL